MRRAAHLRALAVAAVLLAGVGSLAAQDKRRVTEPSFPPSCAILRAMLTSADGGRTLAPADENQTDTARIQRALDECPAGRAVELEPAGSRTAFLSGPLELRSGVTLRIGRGATLFASRQPREYDLSPGSCGVLSERGHGCKALINGRGVRGAAVMGPGVIDGRGWAEMLGEKLSWWALAREAQVKNTNQNCPRLINLLRCDDIALYRVTLRNAPNFHVFYGQGNGFTAWGVIINTPATARNTDGIDPSSATNVTITHCSIHAGDDDVAIKAGGAGPARNITVAHNHFYSGHGMSIGSETNGGVSAVRVTDLTIDGATSGLRIKSNASRGGLVRGVVYKDVCIRDTKNPILLDSHYSFYGKARNLPPEFTGIVFENLRISGPGKITLDGDSPARRLGVTFNNVTLDAPSMVRIVADHAAITLGPGPVNFRPAGTDVTVTGTPGRGAPYSCHGRFPPLLRFRPSPVGQGWPAPPSPSGGAGRVRDRRH